VVLRLHLKGLSNVRASNGKVRLDAAVSIQEGKTQVRVWKDGKEDSPLNEKSPFWADIRTVGGDLDQPELLEGVPAGQPHHGGHDAPPPERLGQPIAALGAV
jgi:hypothetical protein